MAGLFKSHTKMENDTKYSRAIGVPQYLPKNVKPKIETLVNKETYTKLLRHINQSSISEEEKEFLRFAATRHLVFNYSQIADWYAHSNEEMQKLMEESGLVIIDIDDAIVNGYIIMSKRFEEIIDEAKSLKQS